MASVFRLADHSALAFAVANTLTHDEQSAYELRFGIETRGSRTARGAALIRHIFGETPDPDAEVVALLNFIFVSSPKARFYEETFAALNGEVLGPRGIERDADGFHLPPSVVPRTAANSPTVSRRTAPMTPAPTAATSDPTRVFVVHGRDLRPVNVLEQFLIYIGLRQMTWSDARALTGQPSPTTYDIIRKGMEAAGAIIVIFSPDDEARLKASLADPSEQAEDLTGQARQNVLLEAGMAFALAPHKTVFLRSARTREISDISGFNWVKMNGTWDSRDDLVRRLRDAGAAVAKDLGDLRGPHAGPFLVKDEPAAP